MIKEEAKLMPMGPTVEPTLIFKGADSVCVHVCMCTCTSKGEM